MAEMARRFFDNRCEVTHEKFKKRGFVIHHVEELEKGEVLRRHYPDGEHGRWLYLLDLMPLVEKDYKLNKDNPEARRYALIKNGIHTKLDHVRNGVTRLKLDSRARFCKLAMRTIHKKSPRKLKQIKIKENRRKKKRKYK